MSSLQINRLQFEHAFERDADFEDYPQSIFLDRQTGDVLWIYDEDEDASAMAGIPPEENADLRHRVESEPNRFLSIPGLDHGDHHDLLREFLNSDWTQDQEARSQAREAYTGSIGRWKRSVSDSVVHAFHAFYDQQIEDMADVFLREHGIRPEWK
jgi:hypothetical protein